MQQPQIINRQFLKALHSLDSQGHRRACGKKNPGKKNWIKIGSCLGKTLCNLFDLGVLMKNEKSRYPLSKSPAKAKVVKAVNMKSPIKPSKPSKPSSRRPTQRPKKPRPKKVPGAIGLRRLQSKNCPICGILMKNDRAPIAPRRAAVTPSTTPSRRSIRASRGQLRQYFSEAYKILQREERQLKKNMLLAMNAVELDDPTEPRTIVEPDVIVDGMNDLEITSKPSDGSIFVVESDVFVNLPKDAEIPSEPDASDAAIDAVSSMYFGEAYKIFEREELTVNAVELDDPIDPSTVVVELVVHMDGINDADITSEPSDAMVTDADSSPSLELAEENDDNGRRTEAADHLQNYI